MAEPGFWDNQEKANSVVKQLKAVKAVTGPWQEAVARHKELRELAELLKDEDRELIAEINSGVESLSRSVDKLELSTLLGGRFDANCAFLSVNAGAGGTESCDWADMLLRMYTRWAERRGYKYEIEDYQDGEEAGVSRVTFRVIGANAYGYCKAERGVHRLVRISPFDANKRRHTSFSSLDVVAELTEEVEVEVKDEDLRVDTYRSGGSGGQHVNKTDSAVRLTHLPTGLVVAVQSERSQHKNRAKAMSMLKAKIYEYNEDMKRKEMERFYGEKGEIAWGSQIRSYVFQPYTMVKPFN
jgi:peptide chain release factor 2